MSMVANGAIAITVKFIDARSAVTVKNTKAFKE
jgi:hypothetical protein